MPTSPLHPWRLSTARALAILCLALSSSACITRLPAPGAPDLPVPAECTKTVLEQTPLQLTPLPPQYLAMTPVDQARTLARLKALDATIYLDLRATALRCARG